MVDYANMDFVTGSSIEVTEKVSPMLPPSVSSN